MTQMKDSTLDPRWLAEMMRANPIQKAANGNILSGPVRLTFPNLFKPSDRKKDDGSDGKYGASLLFPSGANLQVLSDEWYRVAHEKFPSNWNGNQPVGLHSPFHDQVEKTVGTKVYSGYTPGCIYLNVSSNFRPQVVDGGMNPIADEARVYPGVWAIVAMNSYDYRPQKGKAGKTGVGFGIQSVMLIADDTRLGGGGSDPKADFAAITITGASNVAEKMAAMTGVTAAQPANTGILPPGGFVGQPGALPVQPLVNAEDLY